MDNNEKRVVASAARKERPTVRVLPDGNLSIQARELFTTEAGRERLMKLIHSRFGLRINHTSQQDSGKRG